MRKKICLVEDDKTIAKNLIRLLQSEGFAVGHAGTQREASAMLAESRFDMALVDISLPDGNGFAVCTEIQQTQNIPVIFLTASGDESSVVTGLNMGADDFIAKPFDMEVLILKIQALLRRSYDFSVNAPFLEHRGAVLNTADQTLYVGEQKVKLTKNEYRILFVLLKDKGKVVSREKLMEELWESESFVDENTLTVNINRLRKKLASAGLDEFIATKFGVGYCIS